MDCKELTTLITRFKETNDFTGGVDKAQITFVQNELGVELPESYKWFLSNYGSGGMFGVDIQGVGTSNRPPVIVHTKRGAAGRTSASFLSLINGTHKILARKLSTYNNF